MDVKLNKKTNKKDKNPNWLLRFTLLIVSVPALILAWVLISSMQSSGEPIAGNRFDHALDPKITDEQVTKVKDALKYDLVDSIQVDLKSATLRINVDVANDAPEDHMINIMNDAYNKVNEIIPVDQYFTNREGVKMYDLEIHVYNFIPTDETRPNFIYHILTKNASSPQPVHTNPSRPVNEGEANRLLNPNPEGNGQ